VPGDSSSNEVCGKNQNHPRLMNNPTDSTHILQMQTCNKKVDGCEERDIDTSCYLTENVLGSRSYLP
jgi:hypothetical protein